MKENLDNSHKHFPADLKADTCTTWYWCLSLSLIPFDVIVKRRCTCSERDVWNVFLDWMWIWICTFQRLVLITITTDQGVWFWLGSIYNHRLGSIYSHSNNTDGLSQGFITSQLIILVPVDTSAGGPEFGDVKGDNLFVHPGKKSAVQFPVRMHSPDITSCRLSRHSSNGHSNSGKTLTTTPSPDIDCLRFVLGGGGGGGGEGGGVLGKEEMGNVYPAVFGTFAECLP